MNVSISKSPVSIDDITAIVATYEREKALHKMISSFRNYYPELKIIATDASKRPDKREDIKHILVNKDTGISQQRNIALKEVKTSLFLLLDDDYVCNSKTDIKRLMDNVINGKYVISGGAINNIGSKNYDFHGYYEIIGNTLYHFVDKKNPSTDNYDTIFNFFVGDTSKIKEIGGRDKKLKFAREHDDFFLTIKECNQIVSYDDSVSVNHYNYKKHHGGIRGEECTKYFLSKWNIKNKIEIRLINESNKDTHISYHNFMHNNQNIPQHIKERIKASYGNYPIIISSNV